MASQILSAGRSSRLYRRLVYEAEQALFAEGGYSERRDSGLFLAFAGVRPDGNIDRVEKLLFEEIARLRDRSVSLDELARAKRQLEVSLLSGLAKAHAVGSRLAQETSLFGRVRPLKERLQAIRAVTAADVQRVAARYLVDDRRSVVRVVP